MDSGGFQRSWKRRAEQLARNLPLINYFGSVTVSGTNMRWQLQFEISIWSTVHFTCFKQLYKKNLQTPPTPPFCTSIEKSTLHWRLIRWCRQLRRKKRECLLRNRHSSILPSLPNCHSHGRVDLQDFKIQFQQLRMWESNDDNIGSNNYNRKRERQ